MRRRGFTRVETTPEAERDWVAYVEKLYGYLLLRNAQSWFTGYNSNVEGHEKGTMRYMVFNGGTPKYREKITEVAENGYPGLKFS
jgi:hypothetical protein